MKKLSLIIPALLLASSSLMAQTPSTATATEVTTKATEVTTKVDTPPIEKVSVGVPKVKFKEITHDFGNLKQNVPATYVFEFTNTGTDVISLTSVQASCGCTTPDWTTDPVAVGKSGKISATYNSANAGNFSKTITVTFSDGSIEYLTIKGNVEAAPVVPNTPATPVAPVITPH